MKTRVLAIIVLAAVGLTLAACASTPTTLKVGSPTSPHAVPLPLDPTSHQAADADNGRTIMLNVGDHLKVTLASTYWNFSADTAGAALRAAGHPTTSADHHCVPGGGCGTVTAWFNADGPGTAVVTASRTSCGEAMACGGGAGSYRLTVIVR